jgi:DNA-binding GntR family transcriptional regulator
VKVTGSKRRGGSAAVQDGPAAAVYERLRELIVHGQLAPGARLVERDIAARFSTSRTPVRSALQRLQQERYVTVLDGGKHARLAVAPLTIEDVRDVFEVVGGREAAAARRAALLGPAQRVRVNTQLVEVNGALLLATQQPKPDQNAIFELDDTFHRAYVRGGAGQRILMLHDVIKPQAERYCRLYISALVDRISDSVREHEVIIDGIRQGDADATERAVLVNWRNAADRFSEVIANMGERGIW